jgi:hypothetical protein
LTHGADGCANNRWQNKTNVGGRQYGLPEQTPEQTVVWLTGRAEDLEKDTLSVGASPVAFACCSEREAALKK